MPSPGRAPVRDRVAPSDRYGVPRICFVNKMDRTAPTTSAAFDMIRDRLGARAVVIQLPIGAEDGFKGIVDLVRMKAVIWKEETLGAEFVEADIPADLKAKADEWRGRLVETAVDMDDGAMDAYPRVRRSTRRPCAPASAAGPSPVPSCPCCAARHSRTRGVQPLLDAVVDYLPAPTDVEAVRGIKPGTDEAVVRKSDDSEPFAALAFKVMTDPFVGTLTFVRVYSAFSAPAIRCSTRSRIRANASAACCRCTRTSREDVKEAYAGNIVAIVGLKGTSTGIRCATRPNPWCSGG